MLCLRFEDCMLVFRLRQVRQKQLYQITAPQGFSLIETRGNATISDNSPVGVLISKFSNPQFSGASRRSGRAWSAAARPKPTSRAAFLGLPETVALCVGCGSETVGLSWQRFHNRNIKQGYIALSLNALQGEFPLTPVGLFLPAYTGKKKPPNDRKKNVRKANKATHHPSQSDRV